MLEYNCEDMRTEKLTVIDNKLCNMENDMTVAETKQRIENELNAAKESFGEASSLVSCSVDVEVNHIEGAPVDITYVFGALSIGPSGASEDDRLYLPLDAELNDDDTVDEESFEQTLATFEKKVAEIRERVLASEDYEAEVKAIILDFDREMEEKYLAEIERLNKVAKRNLIIAAAATGAAAVFALLIFLLGRM